MFFKTPFPETFFCQKTSKQDKDTKQKIKIFFQRLCPNRQRNKFDYFHFMAGSPPHNGQQNKKLCTAYASEPIQFCKILNCLVTQKSQLSL